MNFVMAIIVEGYMSVRESLHEAREWRNFPADLVSLMAQAVPGHHKNISIILIAIKLLYVV